MSLFWLLEITPLRFRLLAILPTHFTNLRWFLAPAAQASTLAWMLPSPNATPVSRPSIVTFRLLEDEAAAGVAAAAGVEAAGGVDAAGGVEATGVTADPGPSILE